MVLPFTQLLRPNISRCYPWFFLLFPPHPLHQQALLMQPLHCSWNPAPSSPVLPPSSKPPPFLAWATTEAFAPGLFYSRPRNSFPTYNQSSLFKKRKLGHTSPLTKHPPTMAFHWPYNKIQLLTTACKIPPCLASPTSVLSKLHFIHYPQPLLLSSSMSICFLPQDLAQPEMPYSWLFFP